MQSVCKKTGDYSRCARRVGVADPASLIRAGGPLDQSVLASNMRPFFNRPSSRSEAKIKFRFSILRV